MIIWFELFATVKESLGTRLRQSIRSGNRVVALFVRYIIVLCILYLCILLIHNCPSFPAAFHRILYLCILLIHNWTLPAIRILPFLLSPSVADRCACQRSLKVILKLCIHTPERLFYCWQIIQKSAPDQSYPVSASYLSKRASCELCAS